MLLDLSARSSAAELAGPQAPEARLSIPSALACAPLRDPGPGYHDHDAPARHDPCGRVGRQGAHRYQAFAFVVGGFGRADAKMAWGRSSPVGGCASVKRTARVKLATEVPFLLRDDVERQGKPVEGGTHMRIAHRVARIIAVMMVAVGGSGCAEAKIGIGPFKVLSVEGGPGGVEAKGPSAGPFKTKSAEIGPRGREIK